MGTDRLGHPEAYFHWRPLMPLFNKIPWSSSRVPHLGGAEDETEEAH